MEQLIVTSLTLSGGSAERVWGTEVLSAGLPPQAILADSALLASMSGSIDCALMAGLDIGSESGGSKRGLGIIRSSCSRQRV